LVQANRILSLMFMKGALLLAIPDARNMGVGDRIV
jgi:hypothetical protein